MNTVLITGGSGLVGSAIKNVSLSGDYHKYNFVFLFSKDCDLTNYKETLSTFLSYNPDYVIHLAACVGGLFKNIKYINYKLSLYYLKNGKYSIKKILLF